MVSGETISHLEGGNDDMDVANAFPVGRDPSSRPTLDRGTLCTAEARDRDLQPARIRVKVNQ